MFAPDELLLALTNAQVEFIVIGGVAVGVHGFVRATKDLDIVPQPTRENLARLACLLKEIDAQHVGIGDFSPEEFPYDPTDPTQLGEGANFRLESSLGPLDIMQWVAGIETSAAYGELATQAISVAFRDAQIRVCGLEHLRTMKRAASRPQDLEDLKRLDER
ncbi:MAG TPA: hypothetical protein VK680_13375 [Solirubrobacteraceae bacterium]|jgi:hypothetical protein|nr:hypothetical protein [Solirubrobacteraceae bacterium]